jgi:hypothetical protein
MSGPAVCFHFGFSPNAVGNSLGILYHFIDGTTTAGLLTWMPIYITYTKDKIQKQWANNP